MLHFIHLIMIATLLSCPFTWGGEESPQSAQSIEDQRFEADYDNHKSMGRAQLISSTIFNQGGTGYSVSVYLEAAALTKECGGFLGGNGSGNITLGPLLPNPNENLQGEKKSYCHFLPLEIQIERTDTSSHWDLKDHPLRNHIDFPTARAGMIRAVFNSIGLTAQAISFARKQAADGSVMQNGFEFANITLKQSLWNTKGGAVKLVLRGEISGGYEWLDSGSLVSAAKNLSAAKMGPLNDVEQANGFYGQFRGSIGFRVFQVVLLEFFGGAEAMKGHSNLKATSGSEDQTLNHYFSEFLGIGASVSPTPWMNLFVNLKDTGNSLQTQYDGKNISNDSSYTLINAGLEVRW